MQPPGAAAARPKEGLTSNDWIAQQCDNCGDTLDPCQGTLQCFIPYQAVSSPITSWLLCLQTCDEQPPQQQQQQQQALQWLLQQQEPLPPSPDTSSRYPSVAVQFASICHVSMGQQLAVIGSCRQLGHWEVQQGVKLQWAPGDLWSRQISLPAGWVISRCSVNDVIFPGHTCTWVFGR